MRRRGPGRSNQRARSAGPGSSPDSLGTVLDTEVPAARRFLAGLVAGALVGAAIAGSSLLRRLRDRGSEPDEDPDRP